MEKNMRRKKNFDTIADRKTPRKNAAKRIKPQTVLSGIEFTYINHQDSYKLI